ncbi:MAG: PEP-utilizing enzyme [Actinomycetota bacterium]
MTDDWQAPGPGAWFCLADHFDRPWTAEYTRVFHPSFREGMTSYAREYGMPVKLIDVVPVHGYPYIHVVPLVGPDTSRAAPAALLWLLARVVPTMRRCERLARATLTERPWLAEAHRWWDHDRPAAIAANEALTAVDVTQLADGALLAHLEECEALALAGYTHHFRLHGTDLFPLGLLLADGSRVGIDVATALDLVLAGIADPADELSSLGRAQCIVGGYDIDRPRLCELSDSVVASTERDRPQRAARATPSTVNDAHFDMLLGDARAVFPVRDDNGIVLGAWRMGLLRRAYLELGDRLVAAGRAHERDDVVEATVSELVAGIGADQLAERCLERSRYAKVDPPMRLGSGADLPLRALPPASRTIAAAQLGLRELIERNVAADLEGLGIGDQTVEGPARVASDAEDAIMRLEPGDVLVVRVTSPAFNAVLPLAAALVTEHGGPMSHAAVAARELGIPAIVGVKDATAKIRDGERVRVDARSGSIRQA